MKHLELKSTTEKAGKVVMIVVCIVRLRILRRSVEVPVL